MAFTIDFKILRNSIVNRIDSEDLKGDISEPFSFIEFIKRINIDNVSDDFVVDIYNRYIIEWSKIKKNPSETFIEQRQLKYKQLLKTIQIEYVSQDEERILSNLDYDNPLELEVAIPFFIEKIKDIIQYYTTRRTQIKSSKSKWSIKGSLNFLKTTVAEYIINNYTKDSNTFQKYKKSYQELSSFQSNSEIEYTGLYDTKEYAEEEVSIDNNDFLKTADDYILSSLPITAFSNYTRDSSTLISELKKELFKKYVTLDTTYYSSTTSVDINSTTPFYYNQNLTRPLISRISTTDGLLTQKDIGYYFTSRFIMASKYISPKGISLKDTKEFVGLLPKINTYYQNDYIDYYYWSKYDPTYMGMSNKPVKNKRLKRFHGYESRDISVGDNSGGVNRYTDNIQLWDGVKNESWANDDIFEKYSKNILSRDEKEEYFFNLGANESVYKYSVDIFGNEYYLIKQIDEQKSSQNNAYNLSLFSGSNEPSILIGQRDPNDGDLLGIKTSDDKDSAIGYFESNPDDNLEQISDFHLDDIDYYSLDSIKFNTGVLSSDELSTGKSSYEYGLSTGKLIIRTADSKSIKNYSEFVDDVFGDYSNLYSQLSSDIIDFDLSENLLVITTSDYMFTSKINFNYVTSISSYTELNKNIIFNYNLPLQKSAKYWSSSKNNSVYFSSISATNEYIIPNIKKLDIGNNTIIDINIDNIPISSFEYQYPIELKNISKPNVIKDDKTIFIVTLLQDICENYIFNIMQFKEIKPYFISLIKNSIYKQNYQLLTESLISSDSLTSLQGTVQSRLDSHLNYYSTSTGLTSISMPEFTLSSYRYFDNDVSAIISKDKPSLEYNLSDIVTTQNTPSITTYEESYTYDTKTIYTPSTINLDIVNLSSLNTTGLSAVPDSEHIIKIEYELGGDIFVRNISNENQIFPLFDTSFVSSPLNQIPYVYDNHTGSGINIINIKMYSTSNKIYTFEFSIDQWSIDISNRFGKLELLDSRINNTDSGTNLVLYINSRIPDYIIPLKLINI